MADSFVPDSFMPDKPEKAEPLGPAGKYQEIKLPTVGGRLFDLARSIAAPKDVAESARGMMMTAPLFGLGGKVAQGLAKGRELPALVEQAAPMLGRVGTAMGLGAGKSAVRGESGTQIAAEGLLDGLVSAITEAAFKGVIDPKGTVRGAQAAFEGAKGSLAPAAKKVAETLGRTKSKEGFSMVHPLADDVVLSVKSMSDKPMALKDVAKELATLRGRDYQAAVADVAQALDKVYQGAGQMFVTRIAPSLFEPRGGVRQAIMGSSGQSVADAITTGQVPGAPGVPAGAVAGMMLPQYAGNLAGRFIKGMMP